MTTVACDPDRSRLDSLGKQYRDLRVETEPARLFDDPSISSVIIATPARLHYQLARAALEAGKHVLVEKPFTLHAHEGEELRTLAERRARTLMVAHTFLYHPAVRRMRDYVERGDLGSLYYLHATRTHLGLVRQDVNAVWDLATHDISIFGYLLGMRPTSVSANGGRYVSREREDMAFITLTYPGDILGHIFVSWVDSNKMREVALIGSRTRIVFDDLNNLERLRVYEKGVSIDRPYTNYGEFQLLVRDGDIISPHIDASEPLRVMTEHFLACTTQGTTPFTDARSGIEVVRVLEAIDRSIAAHGDRAQLDWPNEARA